MDTAVKEKWIGALRSGKYRQGKGRLSTNDGKYCCLGVLCEVAVEEGVADREMSDRWGPIYRSTKNSDDYDANILPGGVAEWADLPARPEVPLEGIKNSERLWTGSLDHLNDQGRSFAEIADLIEEHL